MFRRSMSQRTAALLCVLWSDQETKTSGFFLPVLFANKNLESYQSRISRTLIFLLKLEYFGISYHTYFLFKTYFTFYFRCCLF